MGTIILAEEPGRGKDSVLFGVPPFFLFPVAMGVNQQQWQKNGHAYQQHNDDWFMLPDVLDEAGGVFIHTPLIYTDSALCQTASDGWVGIVAGSTRWIQVWLKELVDKAAKADYIKARS